MSVFPSLSIGRRSLAGWLRPLLCAAAVLLPGFRAAAQSEIGPAGFAAATVTTDSKSRGWAYLTWQASDKALLKGRAFAIYMKAGPPTSAASFARQAVVTRTKDPRAVDALLSRAAFLGIQSPDLAQGIDDLFKGSLPPGLNTPGEKIAALLSSGQEKAEDMLNLLGLAHPGIQMALGFAHAERIASGQTTFEIRDYDPATGRDLAILWRVTVTSGTPVVLAAPGAPTVVRACLPDGTYSARSSLVIPLRWYAPDALRAVSPLQRGYNVWRIARTYAEANGYHTTPPSPAVLRALAVSQAANVRRCNQAAVFPDKELTQAQAADVTGNTETIFYTDANGADESAAVPKFTNGQKFYYYVTARDLLGRDGLVSPGVLAEAFELVPPDPPAGVQAVNDYVYVPGQPGGAADQRLKVLWNQPAQDASRPVSDFLIYRWRSVIDVQTHADDPAPQWAPVAVIPYNAGAGAARVSWRDALAASPAYPADSGKVFFYTVRTRVQLSCGPLVSPHSSPVSASINDCVMADTPQTPRILSPCYILALGNPVLGTGTGTNDQSVYRLAFNISRSSAIVDWAEFQVFDSFGTSLYRHRAHFETDPAVTTLAHLATFPRGSGNASSITVKTGTCDGRTRTATLNLPGDFSFNPLYRKIMPVNAAVTQTLGPPDPACPVHVGNLPESDTINPVCVEMTTTPLTREWRIYRSVDDGPQSLVSQGFRDANPVVSHCDSALPPGFSNIAYYGQLIDDQGNGGPIALLGRREVVVTPPKALLAPITAGGTEQLPVMTVRWFCQPSGIERFMVHISADAPPAPPLSFPGGFLFNRLITFNHSYLLANLEGPKEQLSFSDIRHTPRVGATGWDGPLFTFEYPVRPGVDYNVMVRAVSSAGVCGPPSNVQKFRWKAPPPGTSPPACIPWPARPLPVMDADFNSGLHAERTVSTYRNETDYLPEDLRKRFPVAVIIGFVGSEGMDSPDYLSGTPYTRFKFQTLTPYEDIVFKSSAGVSLLPCVVYRYQVPNARFPVVSGDLVQVTPLMKHIAHKRISSGEDRRYEMLDTFTTFIPAASGWNLALFDMQPVLRNASYRYIIVKFTPNGEVDRIIPTNDVEVTR